LFESWKWPLKFSLKAPFSVYSAQFFCISVTGSSSFSQVIASRHLRTNIRVCVNIAWIGPKFDAAQIAFRAIRTFSLTPAMLPFLPLFLSGEFYTTK
jgi:hypothetical protein